MVLVWLVLLAVLIVVCTLLLDLYTFQGRWWGFGFKVVCAHGVWFLGICCGFVFVLLCLITS